MKTPVRHSRKKVLEVRKHRVMAFSSGQAMRDFPGVIEPAGWHFVMGDFRGNRNDSRFFGFVGRKSNVGGAESILIPMGGNDCFTPRTRRFFSKMDT